MRIKCVRLLLLSGLSLLIITGSAVIALGKKPPWVVDPKDPPPVTAPEPTTLSLIGVGLAGAAGYFLVNKKRRK